MSTLSEIEAAVDGLPLPQLEELFAFLAERIGRPSAGSVASEDPFASMIGAFAGPHEPTGRNAEKILYGSAV